jgi:hypothetical protein
LRDRIVGSIVEGLASLYLLRRLATSSTVGFAFGFGLGPAASFTGPWLIAVVGGLGGWRFRQALGGLVRRRLSDFAGRFQKLRASRMRRRSFVLTHHEIG